MTVQSKLVATKLRQFITEQSLDKVGVQKVVHVGEIIVKVVHQDKGSAQDRARRKGGGRPCNESLWKKICME